MTIINLYESKWKCEKCKKIVEGYSKDPFTEPTCNCGSVTFTLLKTELKKFEVKELLEELKK